MCVCVCKLIQCQLNLNISLLESFTKYGMGIIDGFLFQPHLFFYQNRPHFGGKLTSFVADLAQITCVCGCKSVLHYSKVKKNSLGRFKKPEIGMIDSYLR